MATLTYSFNLADEHAEELWELIDIFDVAKRVKASEGSSDPATGLVTGVVESVEGKDQDWQRFSTKLQELGATIAP